MDAHEFMEQELIALYDRGGQTAVENWVRKNRPKWPWEYCPPCDAATPTYDNICAVCFTAREWAKDE